MAYDPETLKLAKLKSDTNKCPAYYFEGIRDGHNVKGYVLAESESLFKKTTEDIYADSFRKVEDSEPIPPTLGKVMRHKESGDLGIITYVFIPS